ncbi:glutamine amidotransferase [Bartonella sp. HY329]|uniref:glutamine amidotransferase n=1 Tax=unclassified Bartonella TaxID=2645622 RepID=UPI0021C88F57|nr:MULTISPECIES: glutamine amidotransferase [unclassified Bartonella]UXM94232.1 glutamine amidotransferase [Bartonella sp. HY329]UXN08555.1 glutamine amidotransferase [Bartonella sp. HY328]
MQYSIEFEPLLPIMLVYILIAISFLVVIITIISRKRGSFLRLIMAALFSLALMNPVFLQEQREPTKAVVAIIVDKSQSQKMDKREQETLDTLENVKTALNAYPQFETRIIEAGNPSTNDDGTATRLFGPLEKALADVPPARQGGAIFITDGQVHDIPDFSASQSNSQTHNGANSQLNIHAPINALITGNSEEYDRRIRFIKAPRFGISNREVELSMQVDDAGKIAGHSKTADVTIKVNGETLSKQIVEIGKETSFSITLPHAGNNIIELSTPASSDEVTDINNHAAILIDGVRENLKVLLISGEPHNGLRTWRDLLKSDTSVDLVHFTILRPPEKQDNTPMNQLSLIEFPTRELFVEKINDFDLVIFDRYQHYDVLPLIYYDYLANYVKQGGALLMATGPEFTGENSLARTPLFSILPALPNDMIEEEAFLPSLTDLGHKHPITRGLEGSTVNPPKWGRWLRQIDVVPNQNAQILMNGVKDKPLFLVAHEDKGRVAMLLSDQGWLWARGYEGGGPYASLYRRTAHWLMKEPELEEEALFATSKGNDIHIRRQSMKDNVGKVQITLPSGKTQELTLQATHDNSTENNKANQDSKNQGNTSKSNGVFTGDYRSEEIGLVHIKNDEFETLALVGPINAPEFGDLISTSQVLQPIADATNGAVIRLKDTQNANLKKPNIEILKDNAKPLKNTIHLRESSDSKLISVASYPLYTGLLALLISLLIISGMWYREGR